MVIFHHFILLPKGGVFQKKTREYKENYWLNSELILSCQCLAHIAWPLFKVSIVTHCNPWRVQRFNSSLGMEIKFLETPISIPSGKVTSFSNYRHLAAIPIILQLQRLLHALLFLIFRSLWRTRKPRLINNPNEANGFKFHVYKSWCTCKSSCDSNQTQEWANLVIHFKQTDVSCYKLKNVYCWVLTSFCQVWD